MENDRQFAISSCPKDGSIWLEELHEYYATRWEPGGYDVDEQPCPVCGPNTQEVICADDAAFGLLAYAVLDAARAIGYVIERLGLPVCTDCGYVVDEGLVVPSQGTAFHWDCYDRRIQEGGNQP